MSALFLGIDIGTSGVRAIAIDAAQAVAAQASARMADFSSDHRDPAGWRGALHSALSGLFAQVAPGRIAALSVDGTSGTMLAIDARGEPVASPLMYNDPVDDDAIVAAIAAAAPADSAALGRNSALARAIALQNAPGAVRIVHQADWIAGQFSGRFDISDENNALKTGYDPVARRWPGWIVATGMKSAMLPQVVAPGTVTGRAQAEFAREFGLDAGCAVVAGTTDGCASFIATGASQPGEAVTALGTTLTLKLLSDAPLNAPQYGLYSHRLGDRWLAGGASNSGGGALAAHFPPAEIETLSARIDPERPTGLDFYPLPKPGERFPINDPNLASRIAPRPADDAVFLQALLEGVAGVEALGYARLAELGAPPLKNVRSVGGGAHNRAFTAIRARRLGVPFAPALSEEAAFGAALLALQGFSA